MPSGGKKKKELTVVKKVKDKDGNVIVFKKKADGKYYKSGYIVKGGVAIKKKKKLKKGQNPFPKGLTTLGGTVVEYEEAPAPSWYKGELPYRRPKTPYNPNTPEPPKVISTMKTDRHGTILSGASGFSGANPFPKRPPTPPPASAKPKLKPKKGKEPAKLNKQDLLKAEADKYVKNYWGNFRDDFVPYGDDHFSDKALEKAKQGIIDFYKEDDEEKKPKKMTEKELEAIRKGQELVSTKRVRKYTPKPKPETKTPPEALAKPKGKMKEGSRRYNELHGIKNPKRVRKDYVKKDPKDFKKMGRPAKTEKIDRPEGVPLYLTVEKFRTDTSERKGNIKFKFNTTTKKYENKNFVLGIYKDYDTEHKYGRSKEVNIKFKQFAFKKGDKITYGYDEDSEGYKKWYADNVLKYFK